MTVETILAFSFAMAIFSATPGAGAFAAVAQSISKGAPSAFLLLTGIILGDAVYIIGAALGLGVLAEQMAGVFYFVKLTGAAYLVYLGWQAWTEPVEPPDPNINEKTDKKSLLAGFFVSVGNPKVIIFYIAFLPTFVDITTITAVDVMTLCFIMAAITYLIEGSYILAARKISTRLQNVSARKAFNRVSGGILIGAGAIVGLRT